MKVPISGPDEIESIPRTSPDQQAGNPRGGGPMGTARKQEIPTDDPAELARLLKKGEEAEACYDRLLRLQADFENYKKRAEKERTEYTKYANGELISELLTVLDDLERARNSASGPVGRGAADEQFSEGIKLIESKFREVLEGAGLKEIEAKGKEFDPNYHEAVMTTPAQGNENNTVAQELQKGYTLHGRVIRPTRVVVAIRGKD